MSITVDPAMIRPMPGHVLVEMLQEDNVLDSGIVIPENVMQLGVQARLVALGPRISEDLKIGDHVIVDHDLEDQTASVIPDPTDPSVEYFILPEDKILVVLEGE